MALTLAAPVHGELEIRKSRFITCVEPIGDRAAALARVAQLRAAHPGATHVCWALMAGGHSAAVDDGEPSGTAGQPMLKVLRHQDLEGVLATVVRYFGGVKLGAGGLVRAYTDAVAQTLLKADKVPIRPMTTLHCSVPYPLEGLLRRELDSAGAETTEIAHGQQVRFSFVVASDARQPLIAHLSERTQGRIEWHRQ